MDKTVGIVGLGIMGSAIARNLVERGWHVIGFDVNPATNAEVARADVSVAGSVAQLTRDGAIIVTSLPIPAAVERVAHERAESEQPSETVSERRTLALGDKLQFESILRR